MFTLNCKGQMLVVDKPLVMGIINATPDSFYGESRFTDINEVLLQAERMIGEGADIVDVGGQSTRPGSTPISAEEESDRLLPLIAAVHSRFPHLVISIDTFYAKVAHEAVSEGASMVNDITGGAMDANMLTTVGKLNVPYVCMHIKGTPETMQQHTHYENMELEILDYFVRKVDNCRQSHIKDVIIDPGFGFAKTIHQNFQLLQNLSVFKTLNVPILCGLSRKSTVYKTLGVSVDEALNGTTVLNTIALMNGANILRVHDVREAKQAVMLVERLKGA
jgi:dihydropteroate synthase